MKLGEAVDGIVFLIEHDGLVWVRRCCESAGHVVGWVVLMKGNWHDTHNLSVTSAPIAPKVTGNHEETDKKRQQVDRSTNLNVLLATLDGTQEIVEVVEGADAAYARLRAISSETTNEVAAFVTSGLLTTEQVQTARVRNRDK